MAGAGEPGRSLILISYGLILYLPHTLYAILYILTYLISSHSISSHRLYPPILFILSSLISSHPLYPPIPCILPYPLSPILYIFFFFFFFFLFFFFFFFLLHPKPLERSHASKAKSCPTTKGNCSSIANADQMRRVSHLSQWGEDFDSPPPATFSAFGIESIPHHRVTA